MQYLVLPFNSIHFSLGIVSYASYLIQSTNFLDTTKQHVLNNWFRVMITIRLNLTVNLKFSNLYSKTSLRNNSNDS